MKVSNGFVIALPNGTFLWCGKEQTMVGSRNAFSVVNDIESATVLQREGSLVQDRKLISDLKAACYGDWKLIPVKVTRTVEITGWGIPSQKGVDANPK